MIINLQVKPLSVNECWKGQRFKTPAYTRYERQVLLMLPKAEITNVERIQIEFGVSSKLADIDNPVKPILDILQKKYGFNDRDIFELTIRKTLTKKGQEYIRITI
jgi:Holliday junction resolvase RusA-like endonuclease